MTMLGLPFVGSYDFLYLPQCSRQRNRIVEMAFINFVDEIREIGGAAFPRSISHDPILVADKGKSSKGSRRAYLMPIPVGI